MFQAHKSGKYRKHSVFRKINKSNWFVAPTVMTIMVNAVWIGYDADNNDDSSWTKTPLEFEIMENYFCIYFIFEIFVRVMALQRRRECFYDAWFRFDALLVVLGTFETWVVPLYIWMSGGDSKTPRPGEGLVILRLARLFRLARMTRLIRVVPEVMTLLKGIFAAFRSVFFTLLLLLVMLYIFGIFFKSQAVGYDKIENAYFRTVGESMWNLLMHATFLDGVSDVMAAIRSESYWLTFWFFIFILLSSFTIMNMLIGIVCQVISDVTKTAKDASSKFYLTHSMTDILECYDEENDGLLSRVEFKFLMANPEVCEVLAHSGTDTEALKKLMEVLFDEADGTPLKGKLPFETVLETMMRLQGNHSSTVTDVVELRKYTKECHDASRDYLVNAIASLEKRLAQPSGAYVPAFRGTVNVVLTLGDKTVTRRHDAALTIGQLLQQFAPELGLLAARDAEGVELGHELLLQVLATSDGTLTLHLHPPVLSTVLGTSSCV